MARRTRYASLLDDPVFLADLEQVEVDAAPPEREAAVQWVVDPPPPSRAALPAASLGRAVLGVVGFLAMMGLGGAAAAYVFADRVASILAR